ncbi:LacI family transcriptional regulator [Sporanaerobium hydrogeniformans]|uniref:LacI family transcriptional regulator n=1 Tax=Sporanaerobium hydrogeniformans TaxID=3072179 RepID=A0AC61DID1_9FIRM|nr:LacI family transcriptional regulator [Sporanaerobium hydrogeniformans]
MKDIAKQTGLGLATISKYLNGGNVLEANRIAIENAIEELNFHVNEFARGLKTNKSKTIGVVIPELSNIFCTSIITCIEDILRQNGYGILVCDCRTDAKLEYEATEFLVNKMVDGIINMPVSSDGAHLQLPLSKNLPVVLIDRKIEGLPVDAVVVNNIEASQKAIEHLLQKGHKDIGIICGPKDVFTSNERLLGYNQAFIKKGILPNQNLISYGDYTVEGGHSALKELLKREPHLSAVFVTNYEMTLGAIIALNELGIKMPEQISLIGFDNLHLAQVIKPKLTIISQPITQIAQSAAHMMLKRLAGIGISAGETINLPTELLMGESVLTKNRE